MQRYYPLERFQDGQKIQAFSIIFCVERVSCIVKNLESEKAKIVIDQINLGYLNGQVIFHFQNMQESNQILVQGNKIGEEKG